MIKKNFTIKRGDATQLQLKISGDLTARKLSFVVKADKVLTSARLIQKRNTLFGGGDTQLKAVYAGSTTMITIYITKADTQDFAALLYYYDIISQNSSDFTDEITITEGEITVDQDVQTDYDGINLPAAAERYIPVLASTLTAEKLVKVGANDYLNSTNTDAEIADAVAKTHVHANKTLLDAYAQTEVDLASAVSQKHSHANKTILDTITQTHLNSIAREDALYNYLFNGVLDENNTILNLDENNFVINIGVL